jgi:hypothetical protein
MTNIRKPAFIGATGWGSCFLWAMWWTLNLIAGRLVGRRLVWTDPVDALGLDFKHNYLASRCWMAGCNPYFTDFGDPRHRPFIYAPIVLWTFAWTKWLSMPTAVRVWSVALIVAVVATAVVAARERHHLGLSPISYPAAVAFMLWAAPTIFAIERGNYDVLGVVLVVGAVFLLAHERVWADSLAGFCVAAAGWLKLYPFILLPGLVVLRRPRVAAWTLISACALALASGSLFRDYVAHALPGLITGRPAATVAGNAPGVMWATWKPVFRAWLLGTWRPLWWVCMILPLVVWVSVSMRKGPAPRALSLAYVLWLVAAGTQLPRVSFDYNLVVLPLSALIVWTGQEPWAVRTLLVVSLLWWQPFALWPRAGLVVQFVCKIAGMVAVAWMIVDRAAKSRSESSARFTATDRR